MTGKQYSDLIAAYLVHNFADRSIAVYREVSVGKSIIGKNRKVDVFVVASTERRAFAIECKYQGTHGTADEKIPYTLDDMKALPMAGCVAYGGDGFSPGVVHMLQGSELAAYCMPDESALASSRDTRELDHLLAMHFCWWDLIVAGKRPFAAF
jgi:hypothetical protein